MSTGSHLPRLRPPLAVAARHRTHHMDRDQRACATPAVGGASARSRLRLARGRYTRDAPRTPRRLSATGVVVNFLTRLAQRNLGIANLVHPRLPSTFEPVNEGANMLSAVEEVPLASPPDLPSLVRSSPASRHTEQNTRSHAQTNRKEGEQARGATRDSTDVADADREDAPVLFLSPLFFRFLLFVLVVVFSLLG